MNPTIRCLSWRRVPVCVGVLAIALSNSACLRPHLRTPAAPLSAACTANPTTPVFAGDPVTVTSTGMNFSPSHTPTYAWTSTGGKLATPSAASSSIDTTGLAPGTYSANATITDPKYKKYSSATCSTSFTVKPLSPPQVSCSANPATVRSGESSTISANATSPDGATITNYAYTASAGTISGNGSSVTLNTAGLPGSRITVTVTATDSHGLTGSCTTQAGVVVEILCVSIEDWGECTFDKVPKSPAGVDNDCKDVLDKLALRLYQMPYGKLDIVGYTDQNEVANGSNLAAQRAVNVKHYLTIDGSTKIDAGRIQPRQGGTNGKATHFYLVPEGGLCSGQVIEGTPVDENVVKGQKFSQTGKETGEGGPPAGKSASCPGIALLQYPSEINWKLLKSETFINVYLVVAKILENTLYQQAIKFGICGSPESCNSVLLADCQKTDPNGTPYGPLPTNLNALVWPLSSPSFAKAVKVRAQLEGLFEDKPETGQDVHGIGEQASIWHWQAKPRVDIEALEVELYDSDSSEQLARNKVTVKVVGVGSAAQKVADVQKAPLGNLVKWAWGILVTLGIGGTITKWLTSKLSKPS